MPTKRPDAPTNAAPKIKFLKHGGGSLILRDHFDGRTTVAKIYQAEVAALTSHLGEEPTLPQRRLIDQCVRLSILAEIAWAELMRNGVFIAGTTSSAFDAFQKASKDERELLKVLGLERRLQNVTKTLRELLDEDTN